MIVDTLKRSFYALLVPLLFLLTGVIIFAGLLTYVEQDGEDDPVSYTHLTLPTIYSV